MKKLKRKEYEERLEKLQRELVAAARWLQHSGKRLLVLFEGRDTAGKGGAIDAIRAYLNPRQCRVVALPKPAEREATQWYFQRYVPHLPGADGAPGDELLALRRRVGRRSGDSGRSAA